MEARLKKTQGCPKGPPSDAVHILCVFHASIALGSVLAGQHAAPSFLSLELETNPSPREPLSSRHVCRVDKRAY